MRMFSILFVCALSAMEICAAEPPPIEGHGDWGQEMLGISCRVTTEKDTFEIGDDVRVLVEVRNGTEAPVSIGLEPLIQVDEGGRLSRQPAELHVTFSQGSPSFFYTCHLSFPRGNKSGAKAVVIQPKTTFSEILTITPWGPTYGSASSIAQPGEMTLTASLWQFLSPDLKKAKVVSRRTVIKVIATQ